MAVQDIYKSYFYNKFLTIKAKEGINLTSAEVEEYLRENVDSLDLTIPQFNSDNYLVSKNENASASKFNDTMDAISQDLTVLYKVFLSLGRAATEDYRRWKYEISILEKRLIDLEDALDALLLLAQDTEGYHSYFLDNLTDLTYVDLDNTTVALDTVSQLAFLSPTLSSTQTTTRIIDIKDNLTKDDVVFKVRTTVGLQGYNEVGNKLSIFDEVVDYGLKVMVNMSKNIPVTCELSVKISDSPIDISSIYMELYSWGKDTSITPLYSIDNYNFFSLPTTQNTINFNSSNNNQATFNFETIQAKWIKFLLTKSSAESIFGKTTVNNMFNFGFQKILFYNEAFTINETHSFISKPLCILDKNSNVREFSKIALEVCENVPTKTSLKYFITPGGSSSFAIDSNTKWYPISPIGRKAPEYPLVLDLGDIIDIEIGNDEDLGLSYDGTATDEDYKNPSQQFNLLSLNADDSVLDEEITATGVRFVSTQSDECILNYQIKDSDYSGSGAGSALTINEDDIQLFRNIGEVGVSDTVQGIPRGWRFENPYYITLIEILSPSLVLDFGNENVIIDNQTKNKVQTITGKSSTFDGIHEIRVHKNNWKNITPDLDTLSDLMAADILYPYNHKLLIEGYRYGSSWLNTEDQVYQGVDLFFARRAKKVSLFDLSNNLTIDNKYSFFALDRDIADTHTGGNSSTRVFVVRVDDTNADFVNEKFILRFNLINQRYSYLRFRADFATETEDNCPVMGAYKLKFAD